MRRKYKLRCTYVLQIYILLQILDIVSGIVEKIWSTKIPFCCHFRENGEFLNLMTAFAGRLCRLQLVSMGSLLMPVS